MNDYDDKYLINMNSYTNALVRDMMQQKENLILEQLNDLISRKLLIIENGSFSLVRESNSNKITYKQTIKLTLKDKEYIEQLEKENKELKEIINKLKGVIT